MSEPTPHPANSHKHLVSLPVSAVIGLIGILGGTFISPLFSDRMAVEHRISMVEQNMATLTSARIEDRQRMEQWGSSIRQSLERMERKIDQLEAKSRR